jgi:hypothetical protein
VPFILLGGAPLTDVTDFSLSKLGIDFLFRAAEKNGGKLLGVAADSASKLKQALSVNFAGYFQSAIDKCSRVSTLFDRSKSLPLNSIYIQTTLEHSGARVSDTKLRDFIAELSANDSLRMFLIVGSAGIGKTFFLRWLFLSLLENASSRIPFYIELRTFNHREDTNLVQFFHDTIVGQRARVPIASFRSAMEDGEYIFILDGLDEVQYKLRGSLSRQLAQLHDTYPGVIVVVSSRPDEGFNSWALARRYTVLPLTKKGTLALINKLPYKTDVRRKFSAEVKSTLYDQHESFLSNPLLTTIMLLTYGDLGDVPSKMHIFYEQAYETLFYRHDTWKEAGLQRRRYCSLAVDEFRRCLSAFCIASYKNFSYEFTTSAALELIKKATEFERIDVDANDFLRDLVESLCILQIDDLKYKFTHRSFQEYFAAVFIIRGPPISLGDLLDNLAVRRGDVVIPMALEMNRSLVEREWILPRARAVTEFALAFSTKALEFATYLLGSLGYDGEKILRDRLYPLSNSPNINMSVLRFLKDLYPDKTIELTYSLEMLEEDIEVIKKLWDELRVDWWNKNREMLLTDDFGEPILNGRWPRADTVFLKVSQQMLNSRRGDNSPINAYTPEYTLYLKFMKECDSEFERWKNERRELDPKEDAEWFSLISCASGLRSIADQITTLHSHLESSLEYSRKTGIKLLD